MSLPFITERGNRGGSFAACHGAAAPAAGYALDGTYSLDVAPFMHFDAAILDGADAANNPSDGSSVSAWGDRSGNATSMDSVQGTGTKQPTFNTGSGDPYGSFDGGDYMEIANGPLVDTQTNGLTVISLMHRSASNQSLVGIGNDSSAGVVIILRGWTGVLTYMGGSTANSFVNRSHANYDDDFTDLNMHTFTKSTGGDEDDNIKWYHDGGSTSLNNANMSAPIARADTLTMKINRIGVGYISTAPYYLTGNLYETMAFDYVLGTDDLNTVKDYFAAKWSTPIAASANTLGAFS